MHRWRPAPVALLAAGLLLTSCSNEADDSPDSGVVVSDRTSLCGGLLTSADATRLVGHPTELKELNTFRAGSGAGVCGLVDEQTVLSISTANDVTNDVMRQRIATASSRSGAVTEGGAVAYPVDAEAGDERGGTYALALLPDTGYLIVRSAHHGSDAEKVAATLSIARKALAARDAMTASTPGRSGASWRQPAAMRSTTRGSRSGREPCGAMK